MATDRIDDDSLLNLTPAQAREIARDPSQAEWAVLRMSALALTAWLHYGLGNTVSQIEQVLSRVFQLPVSGGGLVQQWQRLGEILALARKAGVLHADETGWRVNGRLHCSCRNQSSTDGADDGRKPSKWRRHDQS